MGLHVRIPRRLTQDYRRSLVFIDGFRNIAHLVSVTESISASNYACVSIDTIFRLHGLPKKILSDKSRGLQVSSGAPCLETWRKRTYRCLGRIILKQTVILNAPIKPRSYPSSLHPLIYGLERFIANIEISVNISVHASTTHTPFFENKVHCPRPFECDSFMRGGTFEQPPSRVYSSRTGYGITKYDASEHHIDFCDQQEIRILDFLRARYLFSVIPRAQSRCTAS